jgi:hypothetical protein
MAPVPRIFARTPDLIRTQAHTPACVLWCDAIPALVVVLAMIVGAIVLVLQKTWPGEDGDDR